MEPARTIEEYNAQLKEIRTQANRRRAEAWAMVPETVLGMKLKPITPAIYSLLVGTSNAFLSGRVPTEGDLRNFVWFCSPQFNPDSPLLSRRWRWLQMWRLRKAFRKGITRKNRDAQLIGNFYQACFDIHQIIDNTLKDGLPKTETEEPAEPLAASLEAQLIDMFAREYRQWPVPTPVRHTPIKQLYQLARCIDRRTLGRDAKYHDSDENLCTKLFLETNNSRN